MRYAAELALDVAEGSVDGGRGVDERAVEIEQDGFS